MREKDAFDQWWEWANKDRETDFRTIPGDIHYPVMLLTPEERKDRAIVNETVRTGRTPLRPAGSADRYGVPRADEDGPGPVGEK
jgi:hypothetical protein